MRSRAGIWVRVLAVPVGVVAGFIVLQYKMRVVETLVTAEVVRLAGMARNVPFTSGTNILVSPDHHAAFYVIIEPACSSLASILAIVFLATVLPSSLSRGRSRLFAVSAACIAVFIGNIIRMAGSIVVGVFAGRASLVLFHNWVGSIFGFAYTLGGFMAMLWLMMPSSKMVARGSPATLSPSGLDGTPGQASLVVVGPQAQSVPGGLSAIDTAQEGVLAGRGGVTR